MVERRGSPEFLYPPLVAAYALLASALIGWPLPLIGGVMADDATTRARVLEWFHGRTEFAVPLVAIGALGVWWLILGPVLYRRHRVVHLAFTPFADWFHQRHALWLTLAGLLLASASGVLLFRMLV